MQDISYVKNTAKKVEQADDMKSFDWTGEYSAGDDYISYSLTINTDAPTRWAEYGWQLEAVGIQTFYKIKGYAMRDEKGDLNLHFLETSDGAFYQEENMDMNKTMFKLKKKGKEFKPLNGIWKVTDFISVFNK